MQKCRASRASRAAAKELALGMGKRRVDYNEYIHSAEWKAFARKCKALAGWRCENEKCRRLGNEYTLDAHHLTYARLGHERLTDIRVLCKKCHAEVHGKEFFSLLSVSEILRDL
jgi:hypothetical protein